MPWQNTSYRLRNSGLKDPLPYLIQFHFILFCVSWTLLTLFQACNSSGSVAVNMASDSHVGMYSVSWHRVTTTCIHLIVWWDEEALTVFPQLQEMLPTVPPLPVRWVHIWRKFCWDAREFYLVKGSAWLPFLSHKANYKCSVSMSCLEDQQWCQLGLRLGRMVSQRSCMSSYFLSCFLGGFFGS